MSDEINRARRRFLAAASMTIAAHLGMIDSSAAQSSMTKPGNVPAIKAEPTRHSGR